MMTSAELRREGRVLRREMEQYRIARGDRPRTFRGWWFWLRLWCRQRIEWP